MKKKNKNCQLGNKRKTERCSTTSRHEDRQRQTLMFIRQTKTDIDIRQTDKTDIDIFKADKTDTRGLTIKGGLKLTYMKTLPNGGDRRQQQVDKDRH